jgi:hypothetical protein
MTKKQSNREATMSVHILFTDATIFLWHKPLEVRFTLSKREKRENGLKTNRTSQIQHEPGMVFITTSIDSQASLDMRRTRFFTKEKCFAKSLLPN